ncbi:hypothetical protein DP114_01795 [Brasilonema sennae CENA114]|uniref:Uncharacterized protein n=1 Tax=Brasilonema sennae CENA114 TaxID=415709 RepID=A0A856MAP1_9CYAN|nr:hypothetical protein DP114_01795 [Brasilonema sennae CENA114]
MNSYSQLAPRNRPLKVETFYNRMIDKSVHLKMEDWLQLKDIIQCSLYISMQSLVIHVVLRLTAI